MKVKPLLPEQPVTEDGKRGSLALLEIVQRIIRAIEGKADLSGATFAASATGGATLNIAPGVAPSAPVNGDIWVTATGVYAHRNGVTVLLG